MEYFVYITTNLINGKQYVGEHSTDNLKKDKYLGSGNFTNAKKKYGIHNFERKILEFFPTKQEAFAAQAKYIIEFNTLVPNGYNISPTGGWGASGCISKEGRLRISKANKGHKRWLGKTHTEESKKRMSKSHEGILHTKEAKQKISNSTSGEKNGMYGKHHNEETKQKIRKKAEGQIWPEERKKRVSEKNKGRKYIGELYEMRYKKIECLYCKTLVDKANYSRWHGENCKKKIKI